MTRSTRSRATCAASLPTCWSGCERYDSEADPFDEFRVTEQIEKALDRKVWLPSGGSLVIDRTEAMTVVDVNTGKFVGTGGNLEETVTKNNLEAAEEIVRQLRLRDIGGIIVVDFIDMVLESNRDLVLRRLVECLSRDRTKHQVAEVTSLGLVQMTRKKLGLGLLETFSEPCDVCAGRGVVVHHDPVVRHRSAAPQTGTSSRRPSRGSSAPAGNGASGGTHMITEGMKSALAQIAASTIAAPHVDAEVVAVAAPEAPASPAAPAAPAAPEPPAAERPKKAPQEAAAGRPRPEDRSRPAAGLGAQRPPRTEGAGPGSLASPCHHRSPQRHARRARASGRRVGQRPSRRSRAVTRRPEAIRARTSSCALTGRAPAATSRSRASSGTS